MQKISTRLLALIQENSRYVELEKGSVLFYEGDICKDIFYCLQGTITLSVDVESRDLRELILYECHSGEHCIVNIASAFSQSKAVASARACSDIKGYTIPTHIARKLMVQDLEYQEIIFNLFALRYSTLTRLLENIKYKRLDVRVLEYLQSRLMQQKIKELSISNEEIANALNTLRAVVNRALQKLKQKGVLSTRRGRIVLH